MIIVGLCGRIGAGKDTFADILVEKYGFKKVIMSEHLINPEMEKLGIPITRENQQNFSKEQKIKYGQDVWAKKSIEYAKQHNWNKIVISGIRTLAEVEAFKKETQFILVEIYADEDIRFKRLKERGSVKDVIDIEAFKEQEKREQCMFDLFKKMDSISDFKIPNNSTKEALLQEAYKFIKHFNLN